MSQPARDWALVLARVLEGDRLALLQVARLVNGLLSRWNAYDFRDQWDDVVQEVVSAAALALRDGQLRDPAAALAYLCRTARFKYVDRLRAHLRCPAGEPLAWEEQIEWEQAGASDGVEQTALREALGHLSGDERAAVVAVYGEGWSYDEAALRTGIPLGTLKRRLRDGLARLREELA